MIGENAAAELVIKAIMPLDDLTAQLLEDNVPIMLRSVLLSVLSEGYLFTERPCKEVASSDEVTWGPMGLPTKARAESRTPRDARLGAAQMVDLTKMLIGEVIDLARTSLPGFLEAEEALTRVDYMCGRGCSIVLQRVAPRRT